MTGPESDRSTSDISPDQNRVSTFLRDRRWWSGLEWAVLVAIAAVAYIRVYQLGPDINGDFRNYHVYNALQALSGGLPHDVEPAVLQGHLNGQAYALIYLLRAHLYFPWSDWVILTIQLLSLPLLLLLCRKIMAQPASALRFIICSLTVLVSVFTASWWTTLGTSFLDPLLAPLILGALLLLASIRKEQSNLIRYVLVFSAGACSALAAGLKLTMVPLLIGVAVAAFVILLGRRLWRFVAGLGIFVLGVLVGIAPTIPWYYDLKQRFGSPLFPLYNSFFRSPLASTVNYHDERFRFESAHHALRVLQDVTFSTTAAVSESPYADPKFLVFLLSVVAAGVAVGVRLVFMRNKKPLITGAERLCFALIAFGVVSIALWAWQLFYVRYFVPGELLLGVLILAAMRLTRMPSIAIAGVLAVLTVWTFATLDVTEWEHNTNWRTQQPMADPLAQRFGFEFSANQRRQPMIYFVTGPSLSFVSGLVAPGSIFLRVDGGGFYFDNQIRQELKDNPNMPRQVILWKGDRNGAESMIEPYGYAISPSPGGCIEFHRLFELCQTIPVK